MTPSALLIRHRILHAASVRRGRQRRPPFRPPRPSGPMAAYVTLLNRVVNGLNAKILRALHHAGLPVALRQDSPADGGDGGVPMLPSQRQRALAFLDELGRNPIDARELVGPLDDVAAQVGAFSREQFQRVIRAALGVDVTAGDPGLVARAVEFRTRNIGLIRTLAEGHVARVRGILDASGSSTRVEGIADDLQDATGITARHAALIARDQVLKYNADVTRARHEDAGITEYVWRTSEDERVREDHQALDGQQFSYADPPVVDEKTGDTANPGTYFQCRCTADPVIPGYDDDGDSEGEGDGPDASAGDEGETDTGDDGGEDTADAADATRADWNTEQPRDERGRFGSGGDSPSDKPPSGASAPPEGANAPPVPPGGGHPPPPPPPPPGGAPPPPAEPTPPSTGGRHLAGARETRQAHRGREAPHHRPAS